MKRFISQDSFFLLSKKLIIIQLQSKEFQVKQGTRKNDLIKERLLRLFCYDIIKENLYSMNKK